jgi:hypothetical protein
MAKRSSVTTSIQAAEANNNIVTSFRWGWYGLSLFVPLAGILIGLFLYDQDSREVRKVGRNCLFISFLVWVVFPILIMLVVLIFLGLAAASYVADMLPAGGDN